MTLPNALFGLLWLGGLVATFFPVVPATLVIWLAALLHGFLTGFQPINAWFLLGLGVLGAVAVLVDNLAGLWGAKRFGGSRAGVWGAIVGGFLGLWLGPFGLLLGPFLGAGIAELIAGRAPLEALRSAFGAVLGLLGGIGAKLLLHVGMGVLVLFKIF